MSKLDKGDGELTQCDQEAADVLNDYFASVFEVEEDQKLPTFNEQPYVQMLENIVITNSLVKKAIGHVNSSKSPIWLIQISLNKHKLHLLNP